MDALAHIYLPTSPVRDSEWLAAHWEPRYLPDSIHTKGLYTDPKAIGV